jgi:hypothetical protein
LRLTAGELRRAERERILGSAELGQQLYRKNAPRHRPRVVQDVVFASGERWRNRGERAFEIAAQAQILRVRNLLHRQPTGILLGHLTNACPQLFDAGQIVRIAYWSSSPTVKRRALSVADKARLPASIFRELPVLLERGDLSQEQHATRDRVRELGVSRATRTECQARRRRLQRVEDRRARCLRNGSSPLTFSSCFKTSGTLPGSRAALTVRAGCPRIRQIAAIIDSTVRKAPGARK